MMNNKWKRIFAVGFVAVFGLTWRGAGLLANAQTATGTATSSVPAVEVAHNDFERELQQFLKEIEKDTAAQKIAKQIDDEDVEDAGDSFGDNAILDGEHSDTEIQQEIDNEVDLESPESHGGDSFSNEDSSRLSTSTEDNIDSLRDSSRDSESKDGGKDEGSKDNGNDY